MGRNKLSLEVNGETLMQSVATALRAGCDEVLVVGPGVGHVPAYARRVPDERPGVQGPLAGIEAGLAAANNPLAFVAAGDMPFLVPDLIGHLLNRLAGSGALAVVPRYGGRVHPLCAAYSREVLPLVRTALDGGTRAMRAFLDLLDRVEHADEEELRRFGDPGLLLANVNSPADLERARGAGGP